jgi:small conductance mechanosensitive channel
MIFIKHIKNFASKIDTKYVVVKFFLTLIITIFFSCLAALVYNYIQYISNFSSSPLANNNKIIIETVSHVSYYAILTVGIMFVLVELGFNLNTILVVLGSIGLAIALAVKDSITNVTSGFMILFLNYYNIGDLVETSNVMGFINSFNLFNTTIKDLDNVLVNIPNSSMLNNALTNYYKEKTMKVSLIVSVSNYEKTTNIEQLSRALTDALSEKCEFITDKNDIRVNVADLSKEGTRLKVKFPIESINYLAAKNMAHNIVRETLREEEVFLLDYYYKDK